MSIETDEKLNEKPTLCSWCGIPLGSANTVRESVCIRCYTLLVNAGLKDSEIFSGKKTDGD